MKEHIVLGSALASDDLAQILLTELDEKHFNGLGKDVFRAISYFHSHGYSCSISSVADHLAGVPGLGDYLLDCDIGYTQTGDAFEYSMACIREEYRLKILREMAGNVMASKADSAQLLDYVGSTLVECACDGQKTLMSGEEIYQSYGGALSFDDSFDKIVSSARRGVRAIEGVPTHFSQLDALIEGWKWGSYTVIGARPSSGKTTFGASILLHQLLKDPQQAVAFLSFEMNNHKIFAKMVSQLACVPESLVHSGYVNDRPVNEEEYLRIKESARQLSTYPIYIEGVFAPSVTRVTARIKSLVSRHGCKIIVVDYLTKIRDRTFSGNKHLEIDSISKALQSVAMETGAAVICLAQLNREAKDRAPTMSDFRESGSIEEDADTVIMLWRPSINNPDNKPGVTEAIVAKNRLGDGNTGLIQMGFSNGRFTELPSIKSMVKEINREFMPEGD